MEAVELLAEIGACGAAIRVDGSALIIQGDDYLTDRLRAEIRCLKPQLLTLLREGGVTTELAPIQSEFPGIEFDARLRLWVWQSWIVPTHGTLPALKVWKAFHSPRSDSGTLALSVLEGTEAQEVAG